MKKTLSAINTKEKEKDKRKLNLIIHNVPESTLTKVNERKKVDIQNLPNYYLIQLIFWCDCLCH